MSRKFALASLCLASLMTAACRDDSTPTPIDLSMPGGSDGGLDQSMMLNYTAATIHDIDTGVVAKGTAAKITGVVAISPLNQFANSKKTKCTFQVYVQDPQCSAGPCGIVIQVVQPFPTGQMYCPFADQSGTVIANVKVGDNLDITGVVDNFPDMNSNVVEHELVADSVTNTGGTAMISPTVVTDGSMFQIGNAGSGWAKYEGMLVSIAPTGMKQFISKVDTAQPYDFYTQPGSATATTWGAGCAFGTTFRHLYNDKDMGVEPGVGASFTSITAVVNTVFGGSLLPRFKTDFTP